MTGPALSNSLNACVEEFCTNVAVSSLLPTVIFILPPLAVLSDLLWAQTVKIHESAIIKKIVNFFIIISYNLKSWTNQYPILSLSCLILSFISQSVYKKREKSIMYTGVV